MSSKDIRSFFKPIQKSNNAKNTNINSDLQSASKEAKNVLSNTKSGKNLDKPGESSKSKTICIDPKKEKKSEKSPASRARNESKKSKTVDNVINDENKKTKREPKSKSPVVKKAERKVIEVVSSDSDDDNSMIPNKPKKHPELNLNDDIIESTPPRKTIKRKKQFLDSDSEEEKGAKIQKAMKMVKEPEKLNPVAISEIFGKEVKQAKVESKKKVNTEIGIHNDVEFEKTLNNLDDDSFEIDEDLLNKTIESVNQKHQEEKTPKGKQNISKRKLDQDSGNKNVTSSKKVKLEHVDSGIDDQERFEKKKYCAQLYQKYLNRGGPKNSGSKVLPEGKKDCLANLCFIRTGVLDSLEAHEFEDLIKRHGGKVVQSVSKKVNYMVVGEDPGPAKLQKADDYKIPQISEDELLDMILEKSGMPKKYSKQTSSEDSGMSRSFISDSSKESMSSPKKTKKADTKAKLESSIIKVDKLNGDGVKKVKEKMISKQDDEVIEQLNRTVEKPTNVDAKYENNKIDEENMSLSEKYKPRELKDIIGQQGNNSSMKRLKLWLEEWDKNEALRKHKKITQPKPWDKLNSGSYYKCALLSGPPGVGKTTSATLVAESLGFGVIEFNASDTRSKKLLQQEVANALNTKSLTFNTTGDESKNKRVLLMDEVDGMAGNEDRGGMQELINLIKTSKVPIICMCNDRNHPKIRSLLNYCFDLKFEKPRPQQILGFVMSICCKEGIKLIPQSAIEIINGTTCDIRQTLNQISMIANTKSELTVDKAHNEGLTCKKDTVMGPWEVCKKVFNKSDQNNMSLIDKSRLFFFDYSLGPLYVQENYLKVQPANIARKKIIQHVSDAAEAISMGATIDKAIRGSNSWSLLDTQAIFSSVLPGHYMSGSFNAAVDFPSWLGKNSRRKKLRRLKNEISVHTRISTSGGVSALNLDYSKHLLNAISTPLKKKGSEGVSDAIDVMCSYQLLREDLDSLIELCTWPKKKSAFDGIESKVKSAFTIAYKKRVPVFSYSVNVGKSKKRSLPLDDDQLEEQEEFSDGEDKIENDNLIKVKPQSKVQSKKNTEKPSTSKKGSRPKGKGKK